VTKHNVSRIVRLGLLAPAIVYTIADGTQPLEVTAQSLLTRRAELQLSWQAQKKEFASAIPS
jgi:hypothetical protein